MKTTRPIGISIPHNLLNEIDKMRGMVPRSRFVVALLRKAISEAHNKNGGAQDE